MYAVLHLPRQTNWVDDGALFSSSSIQLFPFHSTVARLYVWRRQHIFSHCHHSCRLSVSHTNSLTACQRGIVSIFQNVDSRTTRLSKIASIKDNLKEEVGEVCRIGTLLIRNIRRYHLLLVTTMTLSIGWHGGRLMRKSSAKMRALTGRFWTVSSLIDRSLRGNLEFIIEVPKLAAAYSSNVIISA